MLIICQLFVVYVSAMVALTILRRERGGAPKASNPADDPSPRAWMVPASPVLIVLAIMNGSRFPYLYVVSGIVFAGLLIGRLLPLTSDD